MRNSTSRLLVFSILTLVLFIALMDADLGAAPAPVYRSVKVRAYRFKARIRSNDGVIPFKVGVLLTGTIAYDLKGTCSGAPNAESMDYYSQNNAIEFQLGDEKFVGVGRVVATVASFDKFEHFGVVAHDLRVPPGWKLDHTVRSQSYSFFLQNVPTKKVITNAAIPDRIYLRDFAPTREVRLDFFHGVSFPGGSIHRRAIVSARLESLEEIRR